MKLTPTTLTEDLTVQDVVFAYCEELGIDFAAVDPKTVFLFYSDGRSFNVLQTPPGDLDASKLHRISFSTEVDTVDIDVIPPTSSNRNQ